MSSCWLNLAPAALLTSLLVGGCGRELEDRGAQATKTTATGGIAGQPIRILGSVSNFDAGATAATGRVADVAPLRVDETVVDGRLQLGSGVLSAFPYRVYEYYAEGVAGRPLLKSDDTIPEPVRQLNGRSVAITGFVLPLRTRKGRVTEFLLLRDQGTCCFGPQAQINHFIRVNFPKGAEFESGHSYRVLGRLKVGETYVQGYLTGLYQLDAEHVEEPAGGAR